MNCTYMAVIDILYMYIFCQKLIDLDTYTLFHPGQSALVHSAHLFKADGVIKGIRRTATVQEKEEGSSTPWLSHLITCCFHPLYIIKVRLIHSAIQLFCKPDACIGHCCSHSVWYIYMKEYLEAAVYRYVPGADQSALTPWCLDLVRTEQKIWSARPIQWQSAHNWQI